MQSLIKKRVADRVLRENGYATALEGTLIKKDSSIIYSLEDRWVIVTVNTLLADVCRHFRVLKFEKTLTGELGGFEIDVPGTGEYQWYGQDKTNPDIILPLLLLETSKLSQIETGTPLYGKLRGECKVARAIWEDSDISQPNMRPDFGFIERSRARQFWKNMWIGQRFSTISPLIRAIGEYHEVCIPNLMVSSFALSTEGRLVPYHAVHSLGIHAVLNKRKLYDGEEET